MIDILRKMLEADPGKSTIEIKDKCSECCCEVIIEITPTSGGYGLQGGMLLKSSTDSYFAKCIDCSKLKSKMSDT